jgi:hypothetical protein
MTTMNSLKSTIFPPIRAHQVQQPCISLIGFIDHKQGQIRSFLRKLSRGKMVPFTTLPVVFMNQDAFLYILCQYGSVVLWLVYASYHLQDLNESSQGTCHGNQSRERHEHSGTLGHVQTVVIYAFGLTMGCAVKPFFLQIL